MTQATSRLVTFELDEARSNKDQLSVAVRLEPSLNNGHKIWILEDRA